MGWKSSPTRAKNTNQVKVGWSKKQAGKHEAPKIVECCSWLTTGYAATPAPRKRQHLKHQQHPRYTYIGATDFQITPAWDYRRRYKQKGRQDLNPMLKLC